MLHASEVEELITVVASMERSSLIEQFRTFPSKFPVDFTNDFLQTQPVDRLRHIFVALCLVQQRMPDLPVTEAA